ncbi:MAG: metallophosphoesterase family protein [Rhizomicrobium sp.]
MRTLAHISDLHFGRADPAVLEGLKHAIQQAKPDVVVVSGDLTQRARRREFMQARDFLQGLPRPQIVVPGNHDVPLYNVLKRWLVPLSNFRRYIDNDPAPFYADDEIAVLGLNTARAFTFKNGRINQGQVAKACARFESLGEHAVRIVATHHPFAVPETGTKHTIVGRAKMAMRALADCRVDIVLSGHLHLSQAITSQMVYADHRAALLIQAGTASSSRRRHEANAFNLLTLEGDHVVVERHGWENRAFAAVQREGFRRDSGGWTKVHLART